MTKNQRITLLKLGLGQIPPRDLKRLKSYIESGKPLLLDGNIVSSDRKYG